MNNPRIKEFGLIFLISYLGILPLILVFIDINIINFFKITLLKEFIFFYTLIIFTFIGAMRWNFYKNSNTLRILYGFIPSLISTFLIMFKLLNFNLLLGFLLVNLCLILQLFCDFIFCKKNDVEKHFFYTVRLPVTLILVLNIFYLISV
jgi:hypothetical protein